MEKMTNRERILSVLRMKSVDRIPFMHWWRHFPRGTIERKARNKGMGLCVFLPFYVESLPNVDVVQRYINSKKGKVAEITYHTPIGSVSQLLKIGVGWGSGIMGRDFKGLTPWRISPAEGGRMIKRAEDYDIVKFIVEDTIYEPCYECLKDFKHYLGEDGIVTTSLPYSPFQKMAIDFVGQARIYIDYARHREKVESLFLALVQKYRELYPLAADAPIEYVNYGDNIDGLIVSPHFFDKYYTPNYNEVADILHSSGKILGSHMDGRLRVLAKSIARTKLDVIEAFTPPPMGDLSVGEALSIWKEKVLWINFPSSVYVTNGTEKVKKHLINLLRTCITGERIILAASTENYVPLEVLVTISDVMKKAYVPLAQETIDEI